MTIDGAPRTFSAAVTFGQGLLAKFTLPGGTVISTQWATRAISNSLNSSVSSFPAANTCRTTLSAAELMGLSIGYDARTRLPSVSDLRAVSSDVLSNNAWAAASWPFNTVWMGEVEGTGEADSSARTVEPDGKGGPHDSVTDANPGVCFR